MTELLLLINNEVAGQVSTDRHGHPTLSYDENWTNDHNAIPLSLSLPLTEDRHATDTVAAVLWGFLPDNEQVLQRWAARFHASPRNPVSLLAHVGEDCAGAAQFVRPERSLQVLNAPTDMVEWLDETAVATRLRQVHQDASATREHDDLGQFSLPGAQPKIALHRQGEHWGVPHGRTPTTHILKPPTGTYDGYVENEHFCLSLARAMGLSTCTSEILHFQDQITICLTRYDRIQLNGQWLRVHQEDFCQTLGVMPHRKYQNQGGPSAEDIETVLKRYSSQPEVDRADFLLALIFNWLVGGSDAHAKNYSLLLGTHGNIRLAPLYDISSALPYPQINRRKLNLAMKIGSHYRWHDINLRDWIKLGTELGFSETLVRQLLHLASSVIPDAASREARTMREAGITHRVIDRLVDEIAGSAQRCQDMLAAAVNQPLTAD